MPIAPARSKAFPAIWPDMPVIAFLVAFDVAARVAPHAPNVMPVAASALFAASILRRRTLALVVPFAAMALSDALIGFGDWRVMGVVYGCLALPALSALLPRRVRSASLIASLAVISSLVFFAATNLAVWAFSGLYAPTLEGLGECYIAALPFLKNTVAGDLFWTMVLFGTYWLAKGLSARRAAAGGPKRA